MSGPIMSEAEAYRPCRRISPSTAMQDRRLPMPNPQGKGILSNVVDL